MSKDPAANKKTVKEPRKLKLGEYNSFRLQKPIKTGGEATIPGAFRILAGSLGVLRRSWKPFLGIVLIYGVLNFLLVQSFNGADLSQTKSTLDSTSTGHWSQLANSFALFVYMAGASGNVSSPVAGAYQLMLTLVTSLALIWTLRQVYAGHKVRVRDGFYRGMYPLVPFVLVLLVAAIQLIPVILGVFIYNLVNTAGILQGGVEAVLWAVLLFMTALISLYMLCSSLFALYIVCLPDMEPRAALKSAKELVKHRRWTIMRKIIFLPITLLVVAALLIVPLVFVAAPLAGIGFFIVSMLGLPVLHSYMYRLYRELL